MSNFSFTSNLTTTDRIESAALGTVSAATNGIYSANDVGRAVKLNTSGTIASNYVDCVSGDEIDGFITSVEPATVNQGYSFGGVMRTGRKVVTAGGSLNLGSMVVAGTQPATAMSALISAGLVDPALGAAQGAIAGTNNGAAAQAVVISGTPARAFWRFIANVTSPNTTTASAGNLILIERL
jgi:hypothetical protein